MKLTNEEARSILDHLIKELKRFGFSDIHNFIVERLSDRRNLDNQGYPGEENIKYYLMDYINLLVKQLRQRSNEEYSEILGSINQYIITDNNEQIKGLQVVFDERETALYKTEKIDLVKLPDYSILVNGLREIVSSIEGDNFKQQ